MIQLKFCFNFPALWEYVIINEVLLILLCFILFYLFICIYLKVIFLRDVTTFQTYDSKECRQYGGNKMLRLSMKNGSFKGFAGFIEVLREVSQRWLFPCQVDMKGASF